MNLENKKVLIVGTGVSGIAAAELLKKKEIDTVLFDGNKNLDIEKLYAKSECLKEIPLILGELTEEQMAQLDVAVLSPGVPTDLPMVNAMREKGIAIWGEFELAYYFAKGRVVAITGTNGKTTTTALTGEIMKNYFSDVRVVGNIGIPYTSESLTTTEDSVTVAEISSFQLETVHEFKPVVSAILNITPDHLDRHHTMEAYIGAKTDITKNQTQNEVCVLNYEDEVLREFSVTCPAKVLFFSSKRELTDGFFYADKHIYYAKDGVKEMVIHVDELNILGEHNYENVMRAIEILTADWGFGWSPKRITLSTIGVLPNLKRYLDDCRCHLAVSLHNPFAPERLSVMPAQGAWPVHEVIDLIKQYDFTGQRRVSFEYTMFAGFNDTKAHADALIRMLGTVAVTVNRTFCSMRSRRETGSLSVTTLPWSQASRSPGLVMS